MLGNLDKENLKIIAMENEKVLKTFNLPFYKEIVLPENTTRIDIWECVGDNNIYCENVIQSIYLGKCRSLLGLAYYAKMTNKKFVNLAQNPNNIKAIYTETDNEISLIDTVDESCLSVETMDELNLLANIISEEYACVKSSSLKLKKILYR